MSKSEAVRVMVRVRPFNSRERAVVDGENEYPMSIVYMHPDCAKVDILSPDGGIHDSYEYGVTFWSIPESQKQICSKPFADQETVFQEMGVPSVESALQGYHTCIFAYGQTGSGKTYTMLGSPSDPGIAPRLVDHLYERLERANRKGWQYSVTLSFMEIYNERIKDLLLEIGPTSPKKRKSSVSRDSLRSPKDKDYRDLKVRQDKVIGVHVDGLIRLGSEEGIDTAEKVKKVMRFGMEHRATAETKMNATSSRSHAIFQICVTAKNVLKGVQRYSHINIVDLAGSERVTASGAQGSTFVEATRINLSLTTLRRVIDALIQNSTSKNKVIPPYRDSILTYILSESLGGNSNTMMLATISPSELNREDTCNTLRYAMKAKSIINTVRKNEQKTESKVGHFAAEINAMKARLLENDPETEEYFDMKEDLARKEKEMQDALEQAKEEERMMDERRESIAKAKAKREELEKVLASLEGVEEEHQELEKKHDIAREEMERVEQLRQEAEDNKRMAEEKLEREAVAKQELEQQKLEAIEKAAALKTDIDLLNRKKFALAFNKAFGMRRQKDTGSVLQSEVHRLHSLIDEYDEELVGVERELVKELMHKNTTTTSMKLNKDRCEELEKSTAVEEKTEELEKLKQEYEADAQEVDLLQERLTELRIRVSGMERSKISQGERNIGRISELKRKLESEHSRKLRLADTYALAVRERDDMLSELKHSRETKAKSVGDREMRIKRKEDKASQIMELRERNEAMQLHLDANRNELHEELRRLRTLHEESRPLSDEMRFGAMLLHLGYGRAAANGQRTPGRPHGLVTLSPARAATRCPVNGRSSP